MSELELHACPVCGAKNTMTRQAIEDRARLFVWYECSECGSLLLYAGHEKWVESQSVV